MRRNNQRNTMYSGNGDSKSNKKSRMNNGRGSNIPKLKPKLVKIHFQRSPEAFSSAPDQLF